MSKYALRILHLEDSPEDAELQNEFLKAEGFVIESARVQNSEDFVSVLKNDTFDLILADNSMPGFDGLSALALAKQIASDVPFIFVSGTIGEEVAIESLRNGATDYVLKHRLNRLAPVVQRALLEKKERLERKRAQDALLESESRYRSFYENSMDAILLTSPDGSIHYANPAAQRMFGRTEEEIRQAGRAGVIDATDPRLPALLEERRRTGRVKGELNCVHKDGSKFPGEICSEIFADQQGRELTCMIIRDVSERHRAIEALQESEERFRLLAENSSDMISRLSLAGVYLYVSPACKEILGYEPEELIGRSASEFVHPDDLRRINNEIPDIQEFAGIKSITLQARHKQGHYVWMESTSHVIHDPNTAAPFEIHTASRDITERKLGEMALKESNMKIQVILNASPLPILSADGEGRIQSWNRAAEELFGWSSDEALGEICPTVIPEGVDDYLGMIRRAFEGQVSYELERFRRKKDGSIIDAHIYAAPQYDANDRITGVTLILKDITDEKQAHKRIERQIAYLTALSEIDQAITSTLDIKLCLGLLLEKVISLINVDAAAVLLLNPQSSLLEFADGRGFRSKAFENGQPLRMGEGYAGRAAMSRIPIFVENLSVQSDNPRLARHLEAEGFVSYYGVPLIAKGQVKGVLELFNRRPLQQDREQIEIINNFASLAAIAIHDVTLFEDLQRSNVELRMAYDATIEGWSYALDLRDKETEGHTKRVTEMTVALARASGFTDDQLMYVRWGSLLHDIGKMGVPDHILLKPDRLTDEEWTIMKRHPQYAYDMLSPIRYLGKAIEIPYYHHEKWDGTGYPHGLKGEQIPFTARLFAVVDIWDALRSDRPYRSAWTREEAVEHIKSLSGSHLDPTVVELFLDMIANDT